MWRVFVVVCLILIVAGASSFMVEVGFVPWIVPLVLATFGLILGGVVIRRRRGTQSDHSDRDRRTKLHVRDLAARPLPGSKTVVPEAEKRGL